MQRTEILNPVRKLDYKVKDQIPKPISLLLHHGALKCQTMARDFRKAHLNVSVLLEGQDAPSVASTAPDSSRIPIALSSGPQARLGYLVAGLVLGFLKDG